MCSLDRAAVWCISLSASVVLVALAAWFATNTDPNEPRALQYAVSAWVAVYALAIVGPWLFAPRTCWRGVLHTAVLGALWFGAAAFWLVDAPSRSLAIRYTTLAALSSVVVIVRWLVVESLARERRRVAREQRAAARTRDATAWNTLEMDTFGDVATN